MEDGKQVALEGRGGARFLRLVGENLVKTDKIFKIVSDILVILDIQHLYVLAPPQINDYILSQNFLDWKCARPSSDLSVLQISFSL